MWWSLREGLLSKLGLALATEARIVDERRLLLETNSPQVTQMLAAQICLAHWRSNQFLGWAEMCMQSRCCVNSAHGLEIAFVSLATVSEKRIES